MIEPTRDVPTVPPVKPPAEHWLKRAFVALVIERRLPYRVALVLDRIANAVGLRRKTVKAAGISVRVRRLTCDERFVQNIIVNHEYTPSGFDIHEHDVVIDIGGNIGTFALFASCEASAGQVFTFEPERENYELLLTNIALNRVKNVAAVQAAVGGAKGTLKLFTAAEGGFHSVLEDRASTLACYELVNSISLKDVFDEYRIERCNFLKIDCEGAEYDILYNLPTEYYSRIDRIAMEYHGDRDNIKRREQSNALVSHLERMGFLINTYTEYPSPFRGGMIRATRTQPA